MRASWLILLIAPAAANAQLQIDWSTINAGAGATSNGSWGAPSAGGSSTCDANCDGSTGIPALTANDFQCFINASAA